MVVRLIRKLIFSRLGFFGAGVAAMYLMDPERGTARRADLAQRAGSVARQQQEPGPVTPSVVLD